MASVEIDRQTRARTDRDLAYALARWQGLPAVAEEWDAWDTYSQDVYVAEWPLVDERLERLKRAATEGRMTDEQRARYDELRCIVARNAPIQRRLIDGA
jgi:hypothetical protein